jgi:hypothetical protein
MQAMFAMAQYITISGTVYDITARRPLEAVAVISTSGRGTVTDSAGRYSITVLRKDSIWFSMIGKTTMKYPVDTISNVHGFDIMIHIKAADLPEVKVRNRYYRYDSLQNRNDYAKVFNFRKPSLRLSNNTNTFNPGTVTVGFDLNEIINMFRFKRNRQILALQRRLLQQEDDRYIDYRFSKAFVRKVTKLTGAELDSFMVIYRPEAAWVRTLNDLELGYYVEQCLYAYKNNLPAPFKGFPRREDEYDE